MNLAIIGRLDLIERMFGKVWVPDEVWHELTVAGKGKPGCEAVEKSKGIQVASLSDRRLFRLLAKDLDEGEAAAISLAVEKGVDLILLDESEARELAEVFKLRKTGVLGILLRAKKTGLITSVKAHMEQLREEAHFWVKPSLYHQILREAGE